MVEKIYNDHPEGINNSQRLAGNRGDEVNRHLSGTASVQAANPTNANNEILKMTPRSQAKFFQTLEKIYQEQELSNIGKEFIEQTHSPEYTIVQAIDDSCILFTVKDVNGA